MSAGSETKTIMEFLAENPNVDVSRAWERCLGIHSKIVDRVRARFPVKRHAQNEGEDYWTSPDKQLEGGFWGYTGEQSGLARLFLARQPQGQHPRHERHGVPQPADPGAAHGRHFRHHTRSCTSTPSTRRAWTCAPTTTTW